MLTMLTLNVNNVNIWGTLWYNFAMNVKKTTSYHHGNLKEALIETALDMVESDGLDAITLRELTQRLGTSRSAVYRHFDSKEALIRGVIEKGFEQLDLLFTPIFQKSDDPVSVRFEKMGRAYLEFAIEKPNLYRLLFGEKYKSEREGLCDYRDESQASGLYALIGLLLEGQQDGIIAKVDPMVQAATVWASIHGLASLLIDGHLIMSDNLEDIYRYSQAALFKGLN